MILTVSAITWKKLTPAQQKILHEEGRSAGDLMRNMMSDQEEQQITKLATLGMQTTRPDTAPFKAKMGPAIAKIANFAGQGNVDKFQSILKKTLNG